MRWEGWGYRVNPWIHGGNIPENMGMNITEMVELNIAEIMD
jgi:hypothetical protein